MVISVEYINFLMDCSWFARLNKYQEGREEESINLYKQTIIGSPIIGLVPTCFLHRPGETIGNFRVLLSWPKTSYINN